MYETWRCTILTQKPCKGTVLGVLHDPLFLGYKTTMAVTPKNKTKTPLTSPLMVSQVFAIILAFVYMAFSMPRLVFNI